MVNNLLRMILTLELLLLSMSCLAGRTISGEKSPAIRLKISLVGGSCVGKTNIICRLEGEDFLPNMPATWGIDFSFLKRHVHEVNGRQTPFTIWIWDMPGVMRLRDMARYRLQHSNGVMIVYDITRKESFEHAQWWFDAIKSSYPFLLPVVILVGNASDLARSDRQISRADAQAYADKNSMEYFEVSALKNQGVQEAFDALVSKALPQVLPNLSADFVIATND